MSDPFQPASWSKDAALFDAEIDGLLSVIELSRGVATSVDGNTRAPSSGGSISIAICNTVPARERVVRAARERFPGLAVVVLTPDATNPYREVERAVSLSGVLPDAIFVAGLELHDPAHGKQRAEALNLSRELWRRRWPVAAVFFIAEPELPVFMKHAPDLWSWKSHLFEFREEPAAVMAPAMSAGGGGWNDVAALPAPARLARRAELEARLAAPADGAGAAVLARRAAWTDELGDIDYALGEYARAADRFEQAAALAEEAGEKRPVVNALVWASDSRRLMGDLLSAATLAQRAIEAAARGADGESPAAASAYSNLATIQKDQGDLPGARTSLERAIAIAEKHFAPDHPTFATSYSNLAGIQKDQGDLPGARASIQRAIAIAEQHLGAEHPNLATMRSNLAMIQRAQGDLPGARASMERAIAIQEKHFAPDHPTFATSYSNLALIQQDQGDLPGARASMERAIAIQDKHFAPDHPNLATSYNNMQGVLFAMKDYAGARSYMLRALAIAEKHFDSMHPTLGSWYGNLATIEFSEGSGDKGHANFRKALAIFRKHFDDNHPSVQWILGWMQAAGCTP